MRILFLDDKQERHATFEARTVGCEVDGVYTARRAIEMLGAGDYDLVMLDHDLDEALEMQMCDDVEDGRTVARWCAEHPERFAATTFVAHSLNPAGRAAMVEILRDAGLDARPVPFGWAKFVRTEGGCGFD